MRISLGRSAGTAQRKRALGWKEIMALMQTNPGESSAKQDFLYFFLHHTLISVEGVIDTRHHN